MIVVSDTSPLTALLSVGEAGILLKLFGEVVIPEAVRNKLLSSHCPLPGCKPSRAKTDEGGRFSRFVLCNRNRFQGPKSRA